MSTPSTVTPATIRRLLYALGTGALVTAAVSLALTHGAGTPVTAVFAMCAASIVIAAAAFEWTEHRAAARQALAEAVIEAAHLGTPEEHRTAVHAAVVALAAGTDEIVRDAQQSAAADADEEWKCTSRDVAVVAVNTLLEEPELLEELARAAYARELQLAQATAENAGVDVAEPARSGAS